MTTETEVTIYDDSAQNTAAVLTFKERVSGSSAPYGTAEGRIIWRNHAFEVQDVKQNTVLMITDLGDIILTGMINISTGFGITCDDTVRFMNGSTDDPIASFYRGPQPTAQERLRIEADGTLYWPKQDDTTGRTASIKASAANDLLAVEDEADNEIFMFRRATAQSGSRWTICNGGTGDTNGLFFSYGSTELFRVKNGGDAATLSGSFFVPADEYVHTGYGSSDPTGGAAGALYIETTNNRLYAKTSSGWMYVQLT